MKVLHVKASLDREMGGSVTALIGTARTTTIASDTATILALTRPHDDLSLVAEVVKEHEVQVSLVPRGRFSAFGFSVRFILRARSLIRQHDLLEVHEVYSFPAMVACLTARLHKVPYAIRPHNSLDPYDMQKHAFAKWLLRPLIRGLIRGASALWFTTREELERSDDHGASVAKVVSPLSVRRSSYRGDGQRFRRKYSLPADTFLVLFFGRLDRKKGLLRTVQAFDSAVRSRNVSANLAIVGSGDPDHTSEVADMIARLPSATRVRMTGYLRDQDAADALDAADLFVLHSDNENFGLAPVEAALAGVPSLLSRDVFIASDLEKAGVAKVIDTTPEALTATLAELMTGVPEMSALTRAAVGARVPFSDDDVAQADRLIRLAIAAKE